MTYNRRLDSLMSLSAASAGANSEETQLADHKGIVLFINVSAITGTTPTLTVTLQGKDQASGVFYNILASPAISATGLTVLRVYPGLTAAANSMANDILPSSIRVSTAIGGTTPSVTATVSGYLVQ